MMMLKNAAPSGMTARKIIVVPCMVNIVLYCWAVSRVLFGTISWRRISRASQPPTSRKTSANRPYMKPIFLWSTVVSQLMRPVLAVGRQKIRGLAGACSSLAVKWDLTVASMGESYLRLLR